MNRTRIFILCCGLIVSALIVWHDLPIEFPGIIGKVVILFVKLSIVLAVTFFAYLFAGGKKRAS